ncbi:hypothetical protein G6F16_008592 [Rhizopus arrhizus]|nr:hypothetical protein G6F21_008458 [Rhizopus arrhizus]KAG0795156.1 hypothetical protein G6F22_005179 [Rhizopus arrhizus]KAG0815960.1 hypothetical protein G6F20_003589 [Rhizopus arrhizus]KAG0826687.1 hypothetical protein G6F19_009169 [Rhizopus arrhizus]KAG0834938.1 hypothetical protein G6F18_006079 [Rhizopus arrhizus]
MHMETLDRMGAGNTIIGMYKQNLDLPPGANQDANEGHGYVHCGSQDQYRDLQRSLAKIDYPEEGHSLAKGAFPFEEDDSNFDIASYISKEFFSEIWLSLVRYRRGRVGEATARRRTLIGQYIQRYLDCISYIGPELKYAQQPSSLEGLKIIVDPSSVELPFQDPIYNQALQRLTSILTSYPVRHTFEQNNIYYDAKANLCEYMMSFYQLARLFETHRLPIFNCFPLRRTWIPGYATIDSKILCQNILERRWTNGIDKMNLWAGIVDTSSAALKPQEHGVLQFRGTIQTDGVGATVLKKRQDRKYRYIGLQNIFIEPTPYITTLNAQQHGKIAGRCVIIGSGRRDLLYCVHENSTADAPRTYKYTKYCQDKMEKTKKYRRICEAIKPQEVQNAEDTLVNPQSLNLQNFEEYLRNRELVTELLHRHYTKTTTNHLTTHPLHRKLKLSKYIRRQKANEDIIAKLKSKFGNDAVFVMGNYSAPNTRYQEPVRGVGFRRLLKKHGFLVYLIDEIRTSQFCPSCENHSLTLQENIKSTVISKTKQS